MIYACTLNPSVDYKLEVNPLHLGALNRSEETAFYPGGKGINVSRVLKNLGTPSLALGFLGGFTGRFILEQLEQEGLSTDFIFHDGYSRINIKLKSDNKETEINGSGSSISEESQELLLKKIGSLTKEDYLVLAGSLPPSISFDYYEKIAAICHEQGVSLIIDTSGPEMKKLLKYSPFLVKPNRLELAEILEKEMNTIDDLVAGGKILMELGAKNVIISMGGDGAIFLSNSHVVFANAPKGEIKSTVGSGDSMVAGFLSRFLETEDPISAFRYCVAAGSATAFSNDLCEKEMVHSLLTNIELKELL